MPGFSMAGTSRSNPSQNWTRSAEGVPLVLVGDPTVAKPMFYNTINPAAFQVPVACCRTRRTMDCFGNADAR
jgi:hypothetical protein